MSRSEQMVDLLLFVVQNLPTRVSSRNPHQHHQQNLILSASTHLPSQQSTFRFIPISSIHLTIETVENCTLTV